MNACNEDLIRQLPLPLAQLYRRAHNAKTAQERHHAAYYLWEAALKLLGCVAVVEYAELGDQDPELAGRLQNLARPALGHWWEFVRRLTPVLADRGDRGFGPVRELLLGRSRDDLPHAAGLDAVLIQALEGRETAGARATVRLTELFDRLVRYRNREFGHGAVGQRPAAFYDRVGRALLAGVPEVLSRLDTLAGRRLLYLADIRRHVSGRWLVERYELCGETSRRLESLDLPDGEAARRLLPERVYLEAVATGVSSPVSGESSPGSEGKLEGQKAADQGPRPVSLHPLLVYEADAGEVLFLNARRGRQRIDYLSYSTGREIARADLAYEQRELLARVLHVPVDAPSVAGWAARSQAEEQVDGPAEERPEAPRRLGEFELLSELGRGGMGVVYRAWQPSLGRQVAVKSLYRTGDPKAEARFAREIRALGRVEHPHLIKIFTSGSEGEQWFYAMELVEGATLAAVCDKLQGSSSHPETVDFQAWQEAVSTVCSEARQAEKSLSDAVPVGAAQWAVGSQGNVNPPPSSLATGNGPRPTRSYVRQAVELARQVAEAAQALHDRGILHRDIKPGNIMVTVDGCQAVLMDLGLAQVADEVDGRLTRTRQFVGTLRYASPEQVLAVGGLDWRSDIYNLGATLWELITLRPMFNATDQMPTPELMRRIQVEDPDRPRNHHPGLSHDLEAIVLKCLEKDPGRRYATARELVRDLEHYQAGEPVQARPVSGLQRTWRWCRRNPAIAGMLAALVAVLLGSLAGLTVLYLNAERQRRLAEHREAGARAITRFYEDHVLAAARPKGWSGGAGKDVTLKEALDQAAAKIDEDFAGQRQLEAAVRNTLGMTYWYLGQFEAAEPHLEKAYRIRLERLGPEHPDTLISLFNLARQRWRQWKIEDAVALSRQALAGQRRVLGPEHADTLWTQLYLGMFLYDDDQLDESEALLRQAIESCKRTLSPDHVQTLFGQNDLAIVLGWNGKLKEALEMDQQTLEGRRRSLGPDHPDTLRSMANLAYALWDVGKLDEAEVLCRQALKERRRVLGDDHVETYWSLGNLAGILEDKGELAEAERLRRQTLKDCQRLRGPDDPETLNFLTNLGNFLWDQGKLEEAEQLLREAVESSRHKLGPESSYTLNRQRLLAWLLGDRGKVKEAEALFRRTLEVQCRVRGQEHPATLRTNISFARLLKNQGKKQEATAIYREVLDVRRRVQGPDHPETLTAQERLADILTDQGGLAEAESLYRSSVEVRQARNGLEHSETLESMGYLADCLKKRGQATEAEKLYRQILDTQRKILPGEHPDIATALCQLASLLFDTGRPMEAEPLMRECLTIREKKLPPSNWRIASARSLLGGCLARQQKFADAEPLLVAGCEGLSQAKGAPPRRVAEAFDRIIELYEKWGKPEQAEAWRKKRPEPGK